MRFCSQVWFETVLTANFTVCTGLLSQLSLVQGPPGTGKSVVSARLLQLLVANREQQQGKRVPPVLVLAHTNSALDQLLEHLLHSTQRIGRYNAKTSLSEEIVFLLLLTSNHLTVSNVW